MKEVRVILWYVNIATVNVFVSALPDCQWRNTTIVTKLGIDFCVPTDHAYVRFWKAYSGFEPEMFSAFTRYVQASTIVLDVGAWMGLTTSYLAKRARLVVGIEPSANAIAHLRRVVTLNKMRHRVHLINAALGYVDGPVFFTGAGDSMDFQLGLVVVEGRHKLRKLFVTHAELPYHGCMMASRKKSANSNIDLIDVMPFKNVVKVSTVACFGTQDGNTEKFLLLMDPRSVHMARFLSKLSNKSLDPSFADSVYAMPFGHGIRSVRQSGNMLAKVQSISVARLLHLAPALRYVGFIKMDVEGAETYLLGELQPLLQDARPVLWISVHIAMIGHGAALAVVNTLRSVFPFVMDTDGRTPFQTSNVEERTLQDLLCLWAHSNSK